METPFVFGKIATKHDFTNREIETARLVSNFISGINSILISPRRWGKSSLVARASEVALKKDRRNKFCFVDLNNIRSEEQFYQNLATEVLRASSTKIQVIAENARKFMGRFIPNLTFSPGPGTEIKLGLDWKEVKKEPGDIIDLPEKLASDRGIKLIICIDEFQNISEFTDPVAFQKQMRAHWQHHHNVSYCLYGSKRHMMMDVFESPSMPFYKFGDIIFLEKI
ncbi:MAG: ATP-binding protein, partial [Bacteroidales bacterium]|nr:ATP-binding protein [Bacteroidales bacterium]